MFLQAAAWWDSEMSGHHAITWLGHFLLRRSLSSWSPALKNLLDTAVDQWVDSVASSLKILMAKSHWRVSFY